MYVCMYVHTVYLSLAACLTSYPYHHTPSVNFSDDSEHLSDDEALPPELKEILKKEKRKKKEAEEETEEGSYPQTTLERRKKVQERKSLLSPRPNRRGEQPAGPSQAMATPKDEKEEVKRLIARVEELEAVSAVDMQSTVCICAIANKQHNTQGSRLCSHIDHLEPVVPPSSSTLIGEPLGPAHE